MRNQRQSRVPLRFEDTVHNINNSKQNKQKTASKKKSNSKEYVNNKDSVEGDGENSRNLGSTREEGEVISDNVEEEALNDEGIYKEKCVNVDGNGNDCDLVLNVEDTEGVFGTDDHEVYSSTEFDCNVPKSPLQNDVRNKGSNISQSTNVKLPNQKSFSYALMEIVQKGSKRWGLTIFGHFVGYHMHISELRYIIRIMWGKFGIAKIDKWKNGCYMFKFRDEIGMNAVLEKGPWMVRNKPLFVQKWSSEIGMTKVEPKKLSHLANSGNARHKQEWISSEHMVSI
ncbi:RNA-directed DNA polymerase, eukaryota, reverse transcriptase zinc-binding domain protein [Tanacetum coccineum]